MMPKSDIKKIKNLRKITRASLIACKQAIFKSQGKLNLAIKFLINNSNIIKKHSLKESFLVCRRNQNKTKVLAIKIATATDFITKNEKFKKLANLILEVALFCQRVLGHRKYYVLKYKLSPKLPLFKIIHFFSKYIFNEYLELKQIFVIYAPFSNFYIHHSYKKAAFVGLSNYIPGLEQVSKHIARNLISNPRIPKYQCIQIINYKIIT
ncbi:hypothetical protein ACWNYL_00240 [Candidatus Karelsulcia muelleri]